MPERPLGGDSDLTDRLDQLASHLTWPPTPELANTVAARIEAMRHREDGPRWRWLRRRGWARLPGARLPGTRPVRLAVAALLLVVALVAVTLVVSPGARRAAADLLGLRDVHIKTVPRSALPAPPPVAVPLNVGQPVTVAQASLKLGFPVRVPALAGFNRPDAVYFSTPPPTGEVSLAYLPRPDLPEASQTGVGLLVTEFRAGIAAGFFAKLAGPDTVVEPVMVHGGTGYWLSGAPHGLFYQDDRGDVFADTLRLASNTLVWQAGPLTLRIEGAIAKERALAIAESIS